MIALKFSIFYGLAGAFSVLAWVGAVALLVKGLKRRPRWRLLFGGLALALLAYCTAELSSHTLNTKTKLDTRAAELAARAEQAEVAAASVNMVENEDGEIELTTQFAESLPSPAGDAPPSLDGPAPGEQGAAQEPAYRQRGKREREEGKKERIDIDVDEMAPGPDEVVHIRSGLMSAMKIAERLNRFALRLVLLACLGFILWDYLKAFNSPLATRWLLPIGGPWLDSFSPRTRTLLVTPRAAGGRLPPEYYAESVLRKGEQLIFLGAEDPWLDVEKLARVKIKSWTVWGVKKLTDGLPGVPSDTEFLLDGAWFRHYAVLVPDADRAATVLAESAELLWQRYETGASARRAVHFVWALPTRPDAEVIARLRRIAGPVNVRLAVWSADDNLLPEDDETFDEVYSEPLEPELRILDELRARSQARGGGADSAAIQRIRAERLAEKKPRDAARQKAREAARPEAQAKAEQKALEKNENKAAAEKAASEKAAQEEAERVAREQAERQERDAAEQAERERLAQEESERIAREDAEEEARLEKDAQDRAASEVAAMTVVPAPESATEPAPTPAPAQSFKFACSSCGQRLEAEPDWVGEELQCPACDAQLTVPSPEGT